MQKSDSNTFVRARAPFEQEGPAVSPSFVRWKKAGTRMKTGILSSCKALHQNLNHNLEGEISLLDNKAVSAPVHVKGGTKEGRQGGRMRHYFIERGPLAETQRMRI